ncbi:hypothetical protein L1785_05225 [Antribacter sp. KLBMP9083]|uniref:DUF4190 domain-containing protein n=1 Tax=Antribacter soli TaxID=2910976 RepID=A0AA41U6J6_9MICO|nr:hypothetical protein [Antribacter soli]MCF4120375.1 hypothetical protein [Antribacter soli]
MSETPAAPQSNEVVADPQSNTLSIVGFILAFIAPVIGIILSAIALKKSGEAGFDNKLAKWGLGLSIAFTVLYGVLTAIWIVAALALASTGQLDTM